MERVERDRGVLARVRRTGVFRSGSRPGCSAEIWRQGLLEYDKVVGIDWSWLAADGAMTKAPLGGAKDRAESH